MKYLGTITDNKDLVTKEYVDNAVAGGGGVTLETVINTIYPVGAIFMSTVSTDPGTYLGGAWEQLKDRFLLGAGDTYQAGDTGGSADAVAVSHTHTQAAHSHGTGGTTHDKFPVVKSGVSIYNDNADLLSGSANSYPYANGKSAWSSRTTTSSVSPKINSAGESGTGKNMPPYLTVYMWRRTA